MDLSAIVWTSLLASIMAHSTPILLAALGEMVVEKSGVLNLGVEGMMILGAISGFIVAVETGSAATGFLAAAVAGAALSSIFAFLGRLHPIGILLAGLLMALTYIGGEAAQAGLGLPAAAIQLLQGMLLFFLLAVDILTNYRVRLKKPEAA